MNALICLAPGSWMSRLKNRSGGGEAPHCPALAATLAVGLFAAQLRLLTGELGCRRMAPSSRQAASALCAELFFRFYYPA